MPNNDDDKNRIAQEIQKQKDVEGFTNTWGGIGIFAGIVVGAVFHSFIIGVLCVILAIYLSQSIRNKMLKK